MWSCLYSLPLSDHLLLLSPVWLPMAGVLAAQLLEVPLILFHVSDTFWNSVSLCTCGFPTQQTTQTALPKVINGLFITVFNGIFHSSAHITSWQHFTLLITLSSLKYALLLLWYPGFLLCVLCKVILLHLPLNGVVFPGWSKPLNLTGVSTAIIITSMQMTLQFLSATHSSILTSRPTHPSV